MLVPYGTFGALAAATLLAGTASAGTYLGGVNMQACCQEQNANSAEQGIANGSGCDDWLCYNPDTGSDDGGINVDECCQETYSNGAAYSGCSGGVYNWACYAP